MPEKIGLEAALDTKNFNKGMADYNKGLEQMNAKTGDTAGKLNGVLGSIGSGLATAATVGATAAIAGTAAVAGGLVAVGVAATDMASQIKQSKNDIVASLGVTEAQAESLGKVAVNVFKDNFAGSVEEATAAVIEARKQLGDLSDKELQDATENAFRMSDAFGVDTTESLMAARTLMDEFGLSQQEAFDFLAKGFQSGLNNSDDFLDSIGEYSNLFAEANGTADQFFSLMQTGMAGGVLGTDKAVDSFKEFQIRFLEGGDAVAEAFGVIGEDYDTWIDSIKSGDMTTAEAFDNIIYHLSQIEDPIERNRVGTALLGTQFEDLGASAVLGIDLGVTSLEDMAGAVDKIDKKYDNLGAVVEGFKRRALVAIAPIGDAVLGIANKAIPYIEKAFDKLEPIIENVSKNVQAFIENIFDGGGFDLSKLFGGEIESGPIKDAMASLQTGLENFGKFWEENGPAIMEIAGQLFSNLAETGQKLAETVIPFMVEQFTKISEWMVENGPLITETLDNIAWFISAMADALVEAWAIIQPIFDLLVDEQLAKLKVAMQVLTGDWSGAWETIQTSTEERNEKIAGIVTNATEKITGAWSGTGDNLKKIVEILWSNLTDQWKTNFELLGQITTQWLENIKTWFRQKLDDIKLYVTQAWENIKTTFFTATAAILTNVISTLTQIYDNFVQSMANILSTVIDTWNDIKKQTVEKWTEVKDSVVDSVNQLVSGAQNALSNGIGSIVGKANEIVDGIKGAFNWDWGDLGSKIVTGLMDGISNSWNSFTSWFSQKVDQLVKDAFLFGSPSKKMVDAGELAGDSLRIGFGKSLPAFLSALNSSVSMMSELPRQAINTTTNIYRNVTVQQQNSYAAPRDPGDVFFDTSAALLAATR